MTKCKSIQEQLIKTLTKKSKEKPGKLSEDKWL